MSKKILIIDDDASVRDAFELALGDEGYRLETADSGQAGLESAMAEIPDLVFLDLKMPGMDGVETLRRLKAEAADLNVYIVTAFAREFMEPLQKARDDGLSFQLAAKPLMGEQIRMIARVVLEA
ncbi:MAG: response regulator [Chromatiales bacterium]|nr:response regulator [Chromatiales bacterium]